MATDQKRVTEALEPAHGAPIRFDADHYDRMVEIGVLPSEGAELLDGRVLVTRPLGGLIEGSIRLMSPIGNRHAACVDLLSDLIHETLRGRGPIRVQGPIRLSDRTEPEPDLVARAACPPVSSHDAEHGRTSRPCHPTSTATVKRKSL